MTIAARKVLLLLATAGALVGFLVGLAVFSRTMLEVAGL
jgi:hypothetical protein